MKRSTAIPALAGGIVTLVLCASIAAVNPAETPEPEPTLVLVTPDEPTPVPTVEPTEEPTPVPTVEPLPEPTEIPEPTTAPESPVIPEPDTPVVDDPTEQTEWPFSTAETIVCGFNSKPAIDYHPVHGWWAYCDGAWATEED